MALAPWGCLEAALAQRQAVQQPCDQAVAFPVSKLLLFQQDDQAAVA